MCRERGESLGGERRDERAALAGAGGDAGTGSRTNQQDDLLAG